MVSASVRYGLVVLVAAVVTLVLRLARGFYWSHALIVGFAVAALVYSTWRTLDRWRPGRRDNPHRHPGDE